MNIKINYCTAWNYESKAAGLAAVIKESFDITPELVPGSGGVYEITVDGNHLFSRREAKRLPDNDEIIALIGNLSKS